MDHGGYWFARAGCMPQMTNALSAFYAQLIGIFVKCGKFRRDLARADKRAARAAAACVVAIALMTGSTAARAQDTATEEAAHRRAVLAQLPPDAAKRVFGLATSAAPGPPRSIGAYTKGCIAGATALPGDGANWHGLRPSRNRAWGHPLLIGFLQHLAVTAGWPGL